jgi:hypothetical protein
MKKKLMRITFLTMALLICAAAFAMAAPGRDPVGLDLNRRILQVNINATIITQDFNKSAKKLSDLVKQYNGTLMNYSSDSNNTSANATIQIPPDKATSFMSELGLLGDIQSQNMSTSDYSTSYKEYARKIKLYEHLSQVPFDRIFPTAELTKDERAAMQAEFANMLRSQLESYRNSLTSYEQYGKYTQCSVYFRKPESKMQASGSFTVTPVAVANEGEKKPKSELPMTLISLALILNFLLIYFLYRKINKTPLGS